MESINAIKIKRFGIPIEKVGDFIYQDGPLLSLFSNTEKSDDYYFYKWSDSDEYVNRWMVFNVSKNSLKSFLFKEISLRDIILKNQFVFYVDIDDDLNQQQYLISSAEEIPDSYLPTIKSFFKEESYTELANSFKKVILQDNIYQILNYLLKEVRMQGERIKQQSDSVNQIHDVLKIFGVKRHYGSTGNSYTESIYKEFSNN